MIPSPCSSAGYPLDIDTSAASLPSALESILEERGEYGCTSNAWKTSIMPRQAKQYMLSVIEF